jgi:glycosyltransferase 2 family protein
MRRRVGVVLKALLTAGLLAFVLHRLDLRALPATLRGLGSLAILLVVVLSAASVLVSAWRWHRVLGFLGETVPVRRLFLETLVGTTYNLILPTSVGGDVVRAVRVGPRARTPSHVWASVVFERVLGLLSLALVSCVGLVSTLSPDQHGLLAVSAAMTVGLAVALAFAPVPFRLAARLNRRAGAALERLAAAFAGPLAGPRARLETFAWSLLYQFVALSILVAAALGWQQPHLLQAVYLGVPIVLVAATVPVTIGGLGLRESLFVVVLARFGMPPERAFALSMVWLASNLLVGLAGLVPLLVEDRN